MIADQYLQFRSELETALAGLLKLASEMRRPSSTLDSVQGLLSDIREPLFIVAVGEVKSGKSSLLNALFGEEFAKVDVLPATDRVCIFRYGDREKSIDVSSQLVERYLPVPFLRDFNVVDTPGTNTMVAEHQLITENFIPRADLVVFVFSVVNPWTQSAWDLLSFVQKKWLKNVVFVLQQADLRTAAEIGVIRRHLQDTAMQKLGLAPPIFAVSARDTLLAQTSRPTEERLARENEFPALKEQINVVVSGPEGRRLKLRSAAQAGQVMIKDIASPLKASLDVIAQDEARLTRAQAFLQVRKEQTLQQVTGLLRGIEQACRESAAQGLKLLEQKLSFWRTWKIIWSRAEWQHAFQTQIEAKLREAVQEQAENAVQLLETDLRALWPQVHDLIDQQLHGDLQDKIPKAIPDFIRQRRELLQSIQIASGERISGTTVEEQLAQLFRETSARLRVPAGVAAAGGIATLIAAMTSAAVADVTGVLAASAAIIGAVLAITQRKKILVAYQQHMETRRAELAQAIERQLNHAIDLFYKEVSTIFQPLAAFCVTQRRLHEPLLKRAEELERTFAGLLSRL
jgi:tRNA U34 5-carboxymethylaminomethyl modifying GTPase MnmE/TrmE